ncbi:MAG: YaiI/YqxD family protein [Pseudomonadota bacterium]
MRVYVDADACPVKAEVMRVATRYGVPVAMVSDGGVRPSAFPEAEMVYVPSGPDAADRWIVDHTASGDLCITGDIPLAAAAIKAGALALTFSGETLSAENIGPRLATRDLMQDIRSADPFHQGKGGGFGKAERAAFLQALDRLLAREAKRA